MSPDISTRKKWRDHFDKIAVTRVQTPDQLTVRREALVAAVCAYLSAKAGSSARKRSSTSAIVQARGRLKNVWKCDDAWIRRIDELGAAYDVPPSKYELSKFLDFPARTAPSSARPGRKHNHAA